MVYQFGEFILDGNEYSLHHNGEDCHVEPLVFDLIRYLAASDGRIVTRDEIIDHVWHGRVVSDATVASCIKSARKALGDSGEVQCFIKTVRGRGLQFVPEVQIRQTKQVDSSSARPESKSASPSLAVLSTELLDADVNLQRIADTLVENLTTVLTRVPLLSLASRKSTSAIKGEVIDAQSVGERLGVSYILESSLQKVSGQLRLNVQLIETRNGFHLWARYFDRPFDDRSSTNFLNDVLPRLEAQLSRAMYNDLRNETGELSGGQLLIKAVSLLALKGWHQSTFLEASGLLRKAVHLEPNLALAHSYLALVLGLGHRVGLLERSTAVVDETVSEAERALDLDDMDSSVVSIAGCALADIGQPARAIPLLKRALDLDPNNGHAWAALGSAYGITGEFEIAAEPLEKGIALSPMDNRLAIWRAVLALIYLQAGNVDRALSTAELGCQNDDRSYLPKVALAAIRLVRREFEEAKTAYLEALRVKPDLSQSEVKCLVGARLGAHIAKLKG